MKKLICFLLVCGLWNSWAWATPAKQRIVVLYAAASPILKALGVDHQVVAVTRHDRTFSHAIKVGSHLHPNVELIKALHPDLIIAGSHRAFPPALAQQIKGARIFYYDPRTLKGVLQKIQALGELVGREKEAQDLVLRLQAQLDQIQKPSCAPRVIYEISERPLTVSGQKDIVTDMIKTAGGINPVEVPRKHVRLSPEKILMLHPDIYIYQVGPMNRHPVPPNKRPYFAALKAQVIRVKELKFARPGLNAFEATLELNQIFRSYCQAH